MNWSPYILLALVFVAFWIPSVLCTVIWGFWPAGVVAFLGMCVIALVRIIWVAIPTRY